MNCTIVDWLPVSKLLEAVDSVSDLWRYSQCQGGLELFGYMIREAGASHAAFPSGAWERGNLQATTFRVD